jgi:hypothetical protein
MYILDDIVEPTLGPDPANATSIKPWSADFIAIDEYDLYVTSRESYDAALGPLLPDDIDRLGKMGVQPPKQKESVCNEADTTRLLHKQVTGVVMSVWTGKYDIVERSQHSPPNSTFTGKVDCQFNKLYGSTIYTLAIGEMKAPGTLDDLFVEGKRKTSPAKRLEKELRG